MDEKIKFKQLSLPLKLGFVGGILFLGYYIFLFAVGFIIGTITELM